MTETQECPALREHEIPGPWDQRAASSRGPQGVRFHGRERKQPREE